MNINDICNYGAENFNNERSVFVFFAGDDENPPRSCIYGDLIDVGIAALIDLKARTNGISFDEAVMRVRETRLDENVDTWLRVDRKERENET